MPKRTCLNCHEKLEGRSDMKFCSSMCRIDYHNTISIELNTLKRQTHKVLMHNRNLLKKCLETFGKRVPRGDLVSMGFNFNYMTSVYTAKHNIHYHYCYDHGYCLLPDNTVLVVKRLKTGI